MRADSPSIQRAIHARGSFPPPSPALRRTLGRALLIGALVLSAGFGTGCDPQAGDTCDTSNECNPQEGGVCDVSVAEGYCTIPNCSPGTCPAEAICVRYDLYTSFCMKTCEDASDCRSDQVCRDEGYCYVPAPEQPAGS